MERGQIQEDHAMIVRELDKQEMMSLLASSRLGRLACSKDGQPYVVPITFSFSESYLYSFSMPGQKIDWMRRNPKVCVQVDEFSSSRDWKCVVIDGIYEELPDRIGYKHHREQAWSLLSKHASWWEPGSIKPIASELRTSSPHLFYRIVIENVTGRQAIDG